MKSTPRTSQADINGADLPTSAADLVIAIENGETAQATALVQTLSQRDYIAILRTVQTLEDALSDYALSWKHAEYWGRGQEFPDEAQATAARA
jgi:catalase